MQEGIFQAIFFHKNKGMHLLKLDPEERQLQLHPVVYIKLR